MIYNCFHSTSLQGKKEIEIDIVFLFGFFQDSDAISAMRAGKLSYSKSNKYWVESSHKRVSSMA